MMRIVNGLNGLLYLLIMLGRPVSAQQAQVLKDGIVVLDGKFDPHLVAPIAEDSLRLCQTIRQAWMAYLRAHPDFKKAHPVVDNGLSYSAYIEAELDSRGKMTLVKKESYSKLGIEAFGLLEPVLEQAKWKPLYRKRPHGRESEKTNLSVFFSFGYGYKPGLFIQDLKSRLEVFKF